MSSRASVIVALTPLAESAVEAALFAAAAPFSLCASSSGADELETHATEHQADTVLLSPDLPGLTPGHCARLRALGLRLVGVALDPEREQQLIGLGVDAVVNPGAPLPQLTAALTRASSDDTPAASAPAPDSVEPAPPGRLPESGGAGSGEPGSEGGRGSVVAVVGGKGAPGASECAASLAAAAGDLWATVLVEVDAFGGGLDLRLGADPTAGSLLAAVRAAGGGRPVGELLDRWLVRRPGWPPVLIGPPALTRALPELGRPGVITATLAGLARCFSLTVCDVGWLLDPTGEQPVGRVHREAVVAADLVLLVIGCRDEQIRSGLAQLDRLLTDLEIPPERLRIAANGTGGPGAGLPTVTLETLIAQLTERGLPLDATLPWDSAALRRAGRRGLPLMRTSRRRGGYHAALHGLLGELFLADVPVPRRRKLKLPRPAAAGLSEEVVLPWRS